MSQPYDVYDGLLCGVCEKALDAQERQGRFVTGPIVEGRETRFRICKAHVRWYMSMSDQEAAEFCATLYSIIDLMVRKPHGSS